MNEDFKEIILSKLNEFIKTYDSPSLNRGYIEKKTKELINVVYLLYNTLSAIIIKATFFDN